MAISKRPYINLLELEQSARWIMCVAAVMAGAAGLAVKTGLVSSAQVYDRLSWYSVSNSGGLIVTKHFDDETSCRKHKAPEAACYAGNDLNRQTAARSAQI